MAIRRGRFKGDASGNGIKIIMAKSAPASYRIFNSGERTFEVHAGHADVAEVGLTCSLDVHVAKNTEVVIKRDTAVEVEGIYDFRDTQGSAHSGRFKGDASGNGITIIQGIQGGTEKKFYRIFNSGDMAFEVHGGGKIATPLDPSFSLDVAVNNDVVIKTAIAGKVEGIYGYLDTQDSIRSGRFKIKTAPTTNHKIIDLDASGKPPEIYYRIFNSGDSSFKVLASTEELIELDPVRSFDFGIDKKRDIYIEADTYPIEGIYEFLRVEG